jgi:type I restriction enzyme S subunit
MPDPIGRACIFPGSDQDCVTVVDVAIARSTQCDPRWLMYYLNSQLVRSAIEERATGSTRKRISRSALSEMLLQVPPLPEQKKIAEILSGIDEQIMSVKSEIQQARKISTAVTKDLIGTIQDESLPLSEVAVNHDSIRVPIKSEERALRSGPYRYFGASGIIDTIDDFLFDGDYILIGEDGANIIDRNKPLAFKVSGKFWVNNHAHIIQPRESCDINFLTYYLESLDYTGIASGSAQPKITRSALDAIQIPIPPLEVQKKIGAVIESTIDMATTAEKKEKKLIDLKQALSYDLLSGRKRVSV